MFSRGASALPKAEMKWRSVRNELVIGEDIFWPVQANCLDEKILQIEKLEIHKIVNEEIKI